VLFDRAERRAARMIAAFASQVRGGRRSALRWQTSRPESSRGFRSSARRHGS
jgi:hypothetical protein